MAPGLNQSLRSLAACLPAAAVLAHVPFGDALPRLRWAWAGAALLLSLAWLIDSARAAAPPVNTLNRRQQAFTALIALGMILFGHQVFWPTRVHQQAGDKLIRVTTRGRAGELRGSYTATADELSRQSEFERANIGLLCLLFGGLLFAKASRDALAPQRLRPR